MQLSSLIKKYPHVQFQSCAGAVGAYHEGRNYTIGSLVADDVVGLNQTGTDLLASLESVDEPAKPAKPKKVKDAAPAQVDPASVDVDLDPPAE